MNPLPPEIWSQIFWYAYSDTGYTGCSISETCRFFNNVGKSTKFRSVALRGFPQVISFWHSVKSFPSHHLQIENMYIYVRHYDADMDEEARFPILVHRGADESVLDKTPTAAVIDVLTAAAPSLIYLYLCLEMNRETVFLPIEFPSLSELVIYGQYNDYHLTLIERLPSLVNLRKLRISNPFGYGDDKAILAVPTYAPYLTHLRLDRHTAYSELFVSALRDALRLSPELSPGKDEQLNTQVNLKFPRSLKRLLIHPGLTYRAMCGFGLLRMQRAQVALESFVKSDSRILLFDHDHESDEDIFLKSLKEWLDKLDGKPVYWEEK